MSWEAIVQVSFFHKCGQFLWCSAFNVVVTAFFSNISSFMVDWVSATSSKAYPSIMVTSLQPSQGGLAPQKSEPTRYSFPLSSAHWLRPSNPFNHPQAFACPRAQPVTQMPARTSYPHKNNNNNFYLALKNVMSASKFFLIYQF